MYYTTTFKDSELAYRLQFYLQSKGIPTDMTVLTSTTPQYQLCIWDENINRLNQAEVELIRFYFPRFWETE